jgi:hypothetical protein
MIKAYRKGATAKQWSSDTGKVSLAAARYGAPQVDLTFVMPSKGGGTTDVSVMMDSEGFAEILKTMIKADGVGAIRKIGETLQASPDATLKACGDIILNRTPAPTLTQAKPVPSVVGFQAVHTQH